MKNIFITIGFMFLVFFLQAQGSLNEEIKMAGLMRSNGKIYVVVAVVLTILAGLLLYLIRIDRKIWKLEKQTV